LKLLPDAHQEHGEQQGGNHLAGHHHHRVDEAVLQRRCDLRVVEEPVVVVEADRLRRLDSRDLLDAVIGERVVEAEEHRPEGEDQEAEQPRQEEQVGDPCLLLPETGKPAPGP
jgi:hypothetical protein